jgi:ankyrin repeat protein
MKRDPTELHLARRNKQPRVVERLLNADPRTEIVDNDEKTALHYAAESGSDESVWLLLQKGANPKAQDNRGQILMDYALREGQAYWLLSFSHETWRKDLNGDTLLLWAIKQRSVATVDWLLARGYNPNATDSNDNSPLINAISSGYQDITRMLLIGGAHLNTKNNLGFPPLVLAARNGHYPIVKLLLDEGVDIEQTGPSVGRRALFEAAHEQHADVVRLLLSRGADVTYRDHDGWTVLALASIRNFDVGIVQQLVEAGADVSDTANPTGAYRPLQEVCHWQNHPVVKYLISKGANMNTIIPGGKTILNAGMEENRPGVVRILIEHGADLHFKDAWGRNALDVARKTNNREVEKMIVERLNAAL